jgi:hypothetical protein
MSTPEIGKPFIQILTDCRDEQTMVGRFYEKYTGPSCEPTITEVSDTLVDVRSKLLGSIAEHYGVKMEVLGAVVVL